MKKFKKDNLIFHSSSSAECLYIVKTGKVLVVKEVDKRIIPIKVVEANGFLGEGVVGTKAAWGVSAIALEDSELVSVPKKEMMQFFDEAPAWVKTVVETITSRINQTQDLLAEHKIIDSELCGGIELNSAFEVKLKKIINPD